ncbi:uncharacterized protein [Nicotiana sylvestris]|uniref:uncharacterized protein n=1 Tax=Nicotiana sylvestris TaxID=4096 RepID=UPI00388C77CE
MENNSVRYSSSPQCHVKLSLIMEYDKLGFAYYYEFNIEDDETLRDFLRISDEYKEFIVIKLLEMYVKVEDVPNNEDVQSQEDDSDYDNNADESGDDTPFPDEGDDEEEVDADPKLTREHTPPPLYAGRSAMWDESRPAVLEKGMYFPDKARLIRAVKIYSVRECREMTIRESTTEVYKAVCRRDFMGYHWMLRASKKKSGLWKVGKYISTHKCEMDTFNKNHFNLNVDLISLVLIPYLEVSIRFKIKKCITAVHQEYMATLQYFISRTIVEWRHERSLDITEYIFNYVFWSFKPVIDGFVHCRPVIFIDGTHVYGKYDIKLLIVVAVDANGQIFPLAFAICANESEETWTLFLNHLKQHVVKQCLGICLISNRHGGILSSVRHLLE